MGMIYLVLSGIMISICIVWIYFLFYITMSLKRSPYLHQFVIKRGSHNGKFKSTWIDLPNVSIIIPARNEVNYVEECLNGLLKQNYQNFEIIVVDDGSTDMTAEILQLFGLKDARIKVVTIDEKKSWSDSWTGKTWACYLGYMHSTGNVLLFTDADTTHSYCTLSLDRPTDDLTLIPRLRAEDFWTKSTLPILWTLSYARYSPQKANAPRSREGISLGIFL